LSLPHARLSEAVESQMTFGDEKSWREKWAEDRIGLEADLLAAEAGGVENNESNPDRSITFLQGECSYNMRTRFVCLTSVESLLSMTLLQGREGSR